MFGLDRYVDSELVAENQFPEEMASLDSVSVEEILHEINTRGVYHNKNISLVPHGIVYPFTN